MVHDSAARVLSSLFPICSNEYNGPLMQIHMLAHNMTFSKTLSGLVIIYQSGISTSDAGLGVDKGGLVTPGRPDSEGRGRRRWQEQPTDFIEQVKIKWLDQIGILLQYFIDTSSSGASTRLKGSLLHIQE